MEPGTTFAGRWIVERPLSSGGMGAVYVAKHADTGRLVAVKVIKNANAELESRFRKETESLAKLSHPNVVGFLDSGVDNGVLFLVMELLHGRGLRSIMTGPVDAKRALKIAADVFRALAAVHAYGIVHRDLKPENVFLVDAVGHDEIAKLIDFGIARLDNSSSSVRATETQTGAVVGTPGYISPEQLRGETATAASDVYAVGVMLYELVTGKFPFEAPSTQAMLVKQLVEPLVPARHLMPSMQMHVDAFITRLLERDPTLRPQSATQALDETLRAIAQLDAALPPSAPTEASKIVVPLPTPAPPTKATPLATPHVPTTSTPDRARGSPFLRAAIAIVAIVGLVVVGIVAFRRPGPGSGSGGGGGGGGGHGAHKGAAAFGGTWNASYSGKFTVVGLPIVDQPNSTVATARIDVGAGGEIALTMEMGAGYRGTCPSTYTTRGRTATLEPPGQQCSFVTPEGSTQTNTTTSARATLHDDGTIVADVEGTFVGANALRVPYQGTFRGKWTFTRR